jgi:hypothetical protein
VRKETTVKRSLQVCPGGDSHKPYISSIPRRVASLQDEVLSETASVLNKPNLLKANVSRTMFFLEIGEVLKYFL